MKQSFNRKMAVACVAATGLPSARVWSDHSSWFSFMAKTSLVFLLLVSYSISVCVASTIQPMPTTYQPKYGIFYNTDPSFFSTAKALGVSLVGYWGASGAGNNMTYRFASPTLSAEPWAAEVKNGWGGELEDYARQAHAAGLQVMADMEGCNAYTWPAALTDFTPAVLNGIVHDLHTDGADRWFTECEAHYSTQFNNILSACNQYGVTYQEGSDPSDCRLWDGTQYQTQNFAELYSQLPMVSMYHYDYRREEQCSQATASQEATLGYAFARGWNIPTALVYATSVNWGEDPANWQGILKGTMLIRALEFRLNEIQMTAVDQTLLQQLNIPYMNTWMQQLVKKNSAEKRPVLNLIIHFRQGYDECHNKMGTSVDAITCGAFHAGYDVVASTEPITGAQAYYVYTVGTDDLGTFDLTPEITALFSSGKKAFLQIGMWMPSGSGLTSNWRSVITACGVDPNAQSWWHGLPTTGVYNGHSIKVTGVDTSYTLTEYNSGTLLSANSVSTGTVVLAAGTTPLVVTNGQNCLILPSSLRWQMMEPISDILNKCGVSSSSNVWGIAGSRVSAFLALYDTAFDAKLPGVRVGTRFRVQVWDKFWKKKRDQVVWYGLGSSIRSSLKQFDTILVQRVA